MNRKPSVGDVEAAKLLAVWRAAERKTAAARQAAGQSHQDALSVAEAEADEGAAKAAYHAAQERLFSQPRVTTWASIGGATDRRLPS
jgi:uncharacterized Zn finger protein